MIFRKDKHRGEKIKDDRGDVVIVPFPFVTSEGAAQKARPAFLDYIMTLPRRLVARRYVGYLMKQWLKDIYRYTYVVFGNRINEGLMIKI